MEVIHMPRAKFQTLTELITYFTWRRQAKKLAEQGLKNGAFESDLKELPFTIGEPWDARKAWQLHKNGQPSNAFLVCYDKYILEISADFPFTTEQMQFISQNIH